MIPLRFQAVCEGCRQPLDTRVPGVAQHVTGWAINRTNGGANQITLRRPDPSRWMCYPCIEARRLEQRGGPSHDQESLL